MKRKIKTKEKNPLVQSNPEVTSNDIKITIVIAFCMFEKFSGDLGNITAISKIRKTLTRIHRLDIKGERPMNLKI